MSKPKHTDGPWEYHPAINYVGFSIAPKGILPTLAVIESPRGNPKTCLINCFNFPGETEANARLIAAAPELLRALQFYVMTCGNTAAVVSRESAQEMYELGQSAIAKAIGKEWSE